MVVGEGNHNANCAKAMRLPCRCTGCWGARHGEQAPLLDLPDFPDGQQQNRQRSTDTHQPERCSPSRSHEESRAGGTDAAAVDGVDSAAHEEVIAHSPQPDGSPKESNGSSWSPASTAATSATMPTEVDDQRCTSLGDSPVQPPSDAQPWPAGAESVEGGEPPPQPMRQGPGPGAPTTLEIDLSEIDQVKVFAEAMMQSAWTELATAFPDDAVAVQEIGSQLLTHHGWCELFVGLVQAIEAYGELLNVVPAWVKQRVKQAILDSSMEDEYQHAVTSAAVDVVIDRVWSAFKGATVGNVPLLGTLTRAETLRSLRILAVVSCPAIHDHEEVREHAWEPLGDEVRALVTAQVRARLARSFEEWSRGA